MPLMLQWVAECVLDGHYPLSRELKMAFQLVPLPVGHSWSSACLTPVAETRFCALASLPIRALSGIQAFPPVHQPFHQQTVCPRLL